MRSRIVPLILAGGVLLAPPVLSAHGTELLLAKLTISRSADLSLEVTADYGGNPLIGDEQAAALILPDSLRIRIGEDLHPLSRVGAVRLERRTQPDPGAPLPPGSFDPGVSHELLTAVWRGRPYGRSVRFEVPKGSQHDVLLWVIEPGVSTAPPRWLLLIEGEATPEILLPRRTGTQWPFLLALGGVILFAVPAAWFAGGRLRSLGRA